MNDVLSTEDSYIDRVTEKKHVDLEKSADIVNQNSQKKQVILNNEGTGEIILSNMYCFHKELLLMNLLFHTASSGSGGFCVCAPQQWQNSGSDWNKNFWQRLD